MDETKIDQTGNESDYVSRDESLSKILDPPGIFNIPAEFQNARANYKLRSKILEQQKNKDSQQYELERLKLYLENKKIDHQNQKTIDDRKEREIQFFTVVFLMVLVLIILCFLFLLLTFSGKYESIFEITKSKPLFSVIYFLTTLLSLFGSGSWVKQKINKWRKSDG